MKQFNYRIGDIEARISKTNPKENKETIEIIKWEGDACYVLAFFTDHERCSLVQNGIYYKDPVSLMEVIKVAHKFLYDERLTEEGFTPIDQK